MKLYYFLKVMQLFSVYRGYDMDIRKIEENNRPTVNNVRRFFKNGIFDKYLNIATAASGITSIDFTKIPVKQLIPITWKKTVSKSYRCSKNNKEC